MDFHPEAGVVVEDIEEVGDCQDGQDGESGMVLLVTQEE